MAKKTNQNKKNVKKTGPLQNPLVLGGIVIGILLIAAAVMLLPRGGGSAGLPADVSPVEGYQLVQKGALLLDVRTQAEWDQYHAIGATLIPLDELPNRLNELPKDRQIVVICHSGNRSKSGRDILLQNGFQATSITGGLLQWYANNLPFEGSAPK